MLCHPCQVPALLRLKRKNSCLMTQHPRDPGFCLSALQPRGLLPYLVQQRLGTSLVSSPLNPCLTPTRLVLLMLGKEKLGALATLAPPKDPGIFFTIFIYQMVS